MSEAEQNKAILTEAFGSWHQCKGDSVDCWMNIMADEVELRSLAEGQSGLEFTTRRRSKAEVGDYLAGLAATFEMIHYTVDYYVAEGDRVVAVGSTSWRHRGTGKVFETPKVDLTRFKNGKITEFFELYDTAVVLAATGGGSEATPTDLT